MPELFDGLGVMTEVTPVDLKELYDLKNMLKLKLVPPPPSDLPERRVYVLWVEIKCDEDDGDWNVEIQDWTIDIVGGVFVDEDRANFAADIYAHRKEYVSSYIQSVKLNELLWKPNFVVE